MLDSKNANKEPLLGKKEINQNEITEPEREEVASTSAHYGIHPTKVIDNCTHGNQSQENALMLRGDPIGEAGINVKKVSGRLRIQIMLSLFFFFVEFVTGIISGSIALIADSYHMAADVMALIVAYICLRMADRQSKSNSYGWVRAEALGGFFNGLFLLTVCLNIFQEALGRIFSPRVIGTPLQVLGVGVVGLLINLIGLLLLNGEGHGHSHGGGGHGHSHGGGGHGHSHANGNGHGHSHGNGDGHSHSNKDKRVEFTESLLSNEETELKPLSDGRTSRANTSFSLERRFTGPGTPYATHMASELLVDDELSSENLSTGSDSNKKSKKTKKRKNVNIHGVYLHLMSDAFGSVIVIFTATCVYFFPNWEWTIYLDPVLSLCLASMMSMSAVGLVKDSINILLMKAPRGINIETVKKDIAKIVGVSDVNDVNIWALTGSRLIASARVNFCHPALFTDAVFKIRKYFHDSAIHSTTIEPTFEKNCMESMMVTVEDDVAKSVQISPKSEHHNCSGNDHHHDE